MVKLLEEISSSPPANENALHLNFSRPSRFAKRVTPRATRKPIHKSFQPVADTGMVAVHRARPTKACGDGLKQLVKSAFR